MEKMTKKQIYTALIAMADSFENEVMAEVDELVFTRETLKAFAQKEIELLDKRAERSRERAKEKKAETNSLMILVQDALSDEFESIADITERIDAPEEDEITVHKVAYQLNQLVKLGIAEKQAIKITNEEGKRARTVQGYRIMAE